MSKYKTKDEGQKLILDAALDMAKTDGFASLSRDGVATKAGVASGSVNYCFDNMQNLKNAVMKKAIENESLTIIAQGIIADNEIAINAPDALRKEALNSMM